MARPAGAGGGKLLPPGARVASDSSFGPPCFKGAQDPTHISYQETALQERRRAALECSGGKPPPGGYLAICVAVRGGWGRVPRIVRCWLGVV